jgi:carbon-monoxide dehydrogenase small subunit
MEARERIVVSFVLNGRAVRVEAAGGETLLEALRGRLGMTGTKAGCEVGECGACTVVIDGKPALSCCTLAGSVEGKRVETVEGLARGGELHPLQEAFLDNDAVACGFCTPGMLMAARALLDKTDDPDEDAIRVAISGNLCRCTGYIPIVKAIRDAAGRMRDARGARRRGGEER